MLEPFSNGSAVWRRGRERVDGWVINSVRFRRIEVKIGVEWVKVCGKELVFRIAD